MIDLSGELLAPERIAIAVDTSDPGKARELAFIAKDSGALIIKQGLEIITAENIQFCANNAQAAGLEWIGDLKLDDIPTTVANALKNVLNVDHPPVAVTIHAHAGIDAMKKAQDVANEHGTLLFAVTELTSQKHERLRESLKFILNELNISHPDLDDERVREAFVHMRALEAHYAGVGGFVAASTDLGDLMKDGRLTSKVSLIPGTRSRGEDTHDQQNVMTPQEAIELGASILVIGRQVTGSKNPEQAMSKVKTEVQAGLDNRGKK